jgi:hypothetical protein
MARTGKSALFVGLILALGWTRTTSAWAQATTVTSEGRDTANFYVVNDCVGGGGEYIFIEGSFEFVAHATLDNRGGIHIVAVATLQGTGIGQTSGDRYHYSETHTFAEYVLPPFPASATFVETSPLISESGGPNWLLTYTAHATVNANGQVTVSFGDYAVKCP